jgi:hypothetical protein
MRCLCCKADGKNRLSADGVLIELAEEGRITMLEVLWNDRIRRSFTVPSFRAAQFLLVRNLPVNLRLTRVNALFLQPSPE